VVLGDDGDIEALFIGPGALIQASAIEVSVSGFAEWGNTQVVADTDHGHVWLRRMDL
jgi:hypothetical protein